MLSVRNLGLRFGINSYPVQLSHPPLATAYSGNPGLISCHSEKPGLKLGPSWVAEELPTPFSWLNEIPRNGQIICWSQVPLNYS